MNYLTVLNELKEKRGKIIADQQAILDLADKEERDLSADEETNYENLETEFNSLTDQINDAKDKHEKAEKRKADLEAAQEELNKPENQPIRPDVSGSRGGGRDDDETRLYEYDQPERYKDALREYRSETGDRYATQAYNDAFRRVLAVDNKIALLDALQHKRALQADLDVEGGFLVVPEQFIARLIKTMDNLVFVRRSATVISVPNAASLGAPTLDTDPDDPTWTSEIRTGTEDSAMGFGKRDLHPHPLAKRIKISKKLLRVARMNIEQIVRDRLAYKFGIVEENAFLNGAGVDEPLGVFTASDYGISTGRDVSTGNTTTAIKADNLINCKYTLKAQYRSRCRWAFHRDAIAKIRKLKTGDGEYLWKQGLSDRPDTILELPAEESEYVPNTFTSGLYVGILGDWSFYWIADALNMNVQVLTELYAESNQNGYIGRKETDGMPVLEEAWVRVALAS